MKRVLDRRAIRKIFVRAPNWLGDVIMATPHFERIRRGFEGAEIVLGVKGGHAPVLDGSTSFDRRISIGKPRGWKGLRSEAAKLSGEDFDLAILFPNSLSSALVCRLAGIPKRLGYTQGRAPLMTHGMRFEGERKKFWQRKGPRRTPVPMVDYWNRLLDIFELPAVGAHPVLAVTDAEERACDAYLAEIGVEPDARIAIFAPTAGFGPSKHWVVERWAELARRLCAHDPELRIVAQCGPGEEDYVRAIVAAAAHDSVLAAIPPLGLDATKALVKRSRLMVTLDSGPRHLAVAFDVPHVVVMGPTHPDYTSSNLEFGTILRHEVDCGPCHLQVCPTDHRCMELIGLDEVFEACVGRDAARDISV